MARKEKRTDTDIIIATEDDLATDTAPAEPTPAPTKVRKARKQEKRNVALPEWFKLDNAANIYPATMTREWTAVYRISVTLTDEVKPDALQQAANDLKSRFPTFYVQVRKGFFWYYLEPTDPPKVQEETEYPCRPFPVGVGNKPLFRILYYKNRISFEAFHSVSDGTGSMSYVFTLVCRYLTLCGIELGEVPGVLDYRDDPHDAELEDSFHRYYKPVKTKNRVVPRAWQYRRQRSMDPNYFRVIKGTFSVTDLKKITHKKGVSITQYLTALVIYSLAQTRRTYSKRPIRVCVPINLRKFFPSTTVRNFSLFANVGLATTNETTLDEITKSIVDQLNESFDKDALQANFSMNVKPEKGGLVPIVPLYLKAMILKVIGRLLGDTRVSTAFSNIGTIPIPDALKPHVQDVSPLLGPSYINGLNVTSSSIGDRMSVVFSSPYPCSDVPAFFFRHLEENGVHVEVESNV